jgi:hypothetical protein
MRSDEREFCVMMVVNLSQFSPIGRLDYDYFSQRVFVIMGGDRAEDLVSV